MRKIFVISWFYPPINSSEGLVTFKHLKNSKYNYVVYTQKNNTSWSYGNKEDGLKSSNIKCEYSHAETFDGWLDEGLKYFIKHENEFDIIMSRSMPPESHILAQNIKNLYPDKLWIASFGDPIAKNPISLAQRSLNSPYKWNPWEMTIRNLIWFISPKRFLGAIMWWYNTSRPVLEMKHQEDLLEYKTIKNANFVICNSEEERDYMFTGRQEKFKSKAVIIPHSYDKTFYPNVHASQKKTVLTFLGHLDTVRTPKYLFEALVLLKKRHKDLDKKLQIEFYGNMSDQDRLFIFDNNLIDMVSLKGRTDYLLSMRIIKSSNWLLHIDPKLNDILENNIFFAAKIADYMGSRNNIFAITMSSGVSANILRNYGAIVCSHSVEEIANFLYLITYKGLKCQVNERYTRTFEASVVSKYFDSFLTQVARI